ncbi:MAG: glycosyltransferase family 2 protein, partial [Verrucomicrobiota bacterium]
LTLNRLAYFVGLDPAPEWACEAAGIVEPQKVTRAKPTPADLGLSADLAEVPAARSLLLDALPRTHDGGSIAGLAMVKNEEGIIEPFVRHNLRFLDVLCVLENGSTDRTRDILLALQREGLPVVVFDDPEVAYLQSEKMTRLLKAVMSTMFPDFVIPIDADEFIKCSSKEQLIASLRTIPSGGVGYVPWQTYVVTPWDVEAGMTDVPRSMNTRRLQEMPQYVKAVIRLDGRYVPELIFTQGNHAVERTDRVPVVSVGLKGIFLGHFPVRNARQMEAKAIVGWMAYLMKDRNSRHASSGYQWREAFDQVIAGGIVPDTLSRMSMMYAQQRDEIDWIADVVTDPMDFQYERRYDVFSSKSVLSTIAKSIEMTLATPPEGFAEFIRRQCAAKTEEMARTQSGSGRSSQTVFEATWHYENLYLDLPPFRHLMDVFQPESVLDVGCGVGAYPLYFAHLQGRDCFGIDGIDASASLLPKEQYLQHDLSKPFDLGRRFDLVLCVEVVEHMAPDAANRLISCVAEHARDRILFSAAEPGQPGHGHINCRPLGEWLDAWRRLGWQCDVLASLSFRALSTFHWLRRNPVVLTRSHGGASGSPRFLSLEEIGQKPYKWHGQSASIVSQPLSEEIPPDLYDF